MKQRIARSLCLLMAFTLAAVCLSACGKGGDGGKETIVTGGGLVPDDKPDGSIYDEGDRLPELYYGNQEFSILTWNNTYTREWVESVTKESDFVDNTIYNRMCNVQERIGVQFKFTSAAGNWAHRNEFIDRVYNAVTTGTESFDLIAQYSLASSIGTVRGLYQDLRTVPYIDYEAPWYSDELVSANIINDSLYYITGDITPSMIYNMYAIIFNKTLFADYNLPEPYSLVDSGEWTFEELYGLVQNLYQDLDQSDSANAKDFYGLTIAEANNTDPFQYAFDLFAVTIDPETGRWGMNEDFTGTRGTDIVQTLQKFVHENDSVYLGTGTDEDYQIFSENRALFTTCVISAIEKRYAPTGMKYGVLPMPMYNADQANTVGYQSSLGMTYTMFSITTDAKDTSMTSAVIEALSSEGYHKMVPAIFEQVFQTKYSNTEDDARMFALVRDTIVYDPGRTFGELDVFALVRIAVRDNNPWSSFLDGQGERIDGVLDKINKIGLPGEETGEA